MTSDTLQATAKRGFLLVEFQYGDAAAPSFHRLTDANVRLSLLGNVYQPDPKMELDLAPFTAGVGEKPSNLTIGRGSTLFSDDISNGRAWSATTITILEYLFTDNLGGGETELLYLLRGEMSGATRNPNGRTDLVKIEILNPKSTLDFPVGIQANAGCVNSLGDALCKVGVNALGVAANITAIDGLEIEIAGLPASPYTYWHRGRVEKDGIRIMTREWIEGTTFRLAQLPPKLWLDNVNGFGAQAVTVFPGCGKGVWPCRNLYLNLDNFMGAGIAAPTYNPAFENPDQ